VERQLWCSASRHRARCRRSSYRPQARVTGHGSVSCQKSSAPAVVSMRAWRTEGSGLDRSWGCAGRLCVRRLSKTERSL
jgi:hypothetical protein